MSTRQDSAPFDLYIPLLCEVCVVVAFVFSHATNATFAERVEALTVSGGAALVVSVMTALHWRAARWWSRGYHVGLIGLALWMTGVAALFFTG